MGSGASKPEWYPGEPTTTAADDVLDACSCEPPVCLGSDGGGGGATTAATSSSSSRKNGGSTGSGNERREITSLPIVELTDMEFIANGAFCSVFACKYRGWSVVAKRVRADLPLTERREALANMWTEYDCLRPLHHPNVIDVYGMCRVKCRDDYCDWNEKDVCLLLERLALGTVGHLFGTTYDMEKNLATTLARSRKMKMVPFRCRLDRALELALALEYVHGGAGIGTMMHRDIKSVNVGFALNGSLKLMDFGLSKVVAPHGAPENDTYQMTGEVGSYRYMAPELVRHEPYNAKADIYSWAILSWEVLAVSRPYAGITESIFIKKVIMDGHRPEIRKSWPERLRSLLASAWHADFSKRPTAAQIVSVLEDVKAELPEREQRRPSLNAPSVGNTPRSHRNSRAQRSVSAPGSICHARRSIVHGSSVGDAGGVSVGSGVGGGDGGGGGAVSPVGSPTTPATKRFSFPLSRASPAAKRRWSFVGRTSTPRQAQGTSRGSKTSESKTKTALPPPPTLSLALTSMPTTDEDDDGRPQPHPDETSLPCCRYHQEAPSQREIIADALAQEAEGARQKAGARQEATARSARYSGRTTGEGRFADRDRLYAEREALAVEERALRAYLDEAEEGNRAGPRSAGVDDIADVALDSSQETAEEIAARARRNSSSQETAEEIPARARCHSSSQGLAEEVHVRARRDTSMETTTEDAPARGRRHSSSQETADGEGVGMNRGGSLSKLWPSKSNRSIETEEPSKSWSFTVGRTRSAGEPYAASTIVLGGENGGDDDRLAAESVGAPADRPTAPFAATGVRDVDRIERPVKRSKNPRAYAVEENGYNPLERAPL